LEGRKADIYLVIDLGTTGLKVGLIDDSGIVLGTGCSEYEISAPLEGYAEQDPDDWWRGFVQSCQDLSKKLPGEYSRIEGIGICGQMHTQVYMDSSEKVLRPAITWMDQRSSGIVSRINTDPGSKKLVFEHTQNIATTTYTAPQVSWVKENQPELWRKVDHVLIAKDYLKYRLTGNMVTDFSDACGTLLFNVEKRAWSEDMFRLFGIKRDLFPEALPSDEIIGVVSDEASRITGLKAGTPVANGSTDNSSAALGAGMVKSGQVTLIIGTAGVISVCSDKPLPDVENRTLCWNYCLRDKWITLGITQTAGESLNWFKKAFDKNNRGDPASGDIFEQYNQSIEDIPDGSGGLIFLPYLNGERTPYWDSNARGVYFGINLLSTKAHFIKAIMEGVSFALRNCVETVESLGVAIDEIRAVGGGLKSDAWLNTLGKIIRKPIHTVKMADTGLVGNMLICRKALGHSGSIAESAGRVVEFEKTILYREPSPTYERQYALFLDLYNNLRASFSNSMDEHYRRSSQ
jgi:xylulokinase